MFPVGGGGGDKYNPEEFTNLPPLPPQQYLDTTAFQSFQWENFDLFHGGGRALPAQSPGNANFKQKNDNFLIF